MNRPKGGLIDFRIDGLDAMRAAFDPALVEKALAVSIQKTLRKTRTQVSKEVRKVYASIAAKDVGAAVGLKIHRISFSPPKFALKYSAKRISLRKFGAKRKRVMSAKGPRVGVEVKVRKDRGFKLIRAGGGYSGGFFGPNNQVYVRVSSERKPIEKRSGIAIPQMVGTERTSDVAFKFMVKEMPKQLDVNMNYFMERAAGRL